MSALRKLLSLVVITVLVSCATRETKRPGPEIPVAPPPTPTVAPQAQPAPPQEPLRVGLVLGGAGVASFATVGILKRFHQEGVQIDFILATGWPALFALGEANFKSVHDLEWFAMRLKPTEFFGTGLFDFSKDFSTHDKLTAAIRDAFKGLSDLKDSKIPVILTASPIGKTEVEVYTSGYWEAPLLKAMSVPGIYRPYPPGNANGWVSSVNGVDVKEALKRRPPVVVAVDMYGDYLQYLMKNPMENSGSVFRTLYGTQFRENLAAQMALAPVRGRIVLNVSPSELDRRREAILAGFKEGARLVTELRKTVGE